MTWKEIELDLEKVDVGKLRGKWMRPRITVNAHVMERGWTIIYMYYLALTTTVEIPGDTPIKKAIFLYQQHGSFSGGPPNRNPTYDYPDILRDETSLY